MLKKAFLFFLSLFTIGVIAIVLFVVAVNKNAFGHLYSQQELLNFKNEIASVVTSEDGKPLGKIFTENRTNAHYEEFPQHLINALVATEDVRYFKHGGIDSRSLLRVLVKTILLGDKSAGGGSTLNQQLSKNISGRKGSGRFNMLVNKTKEGLMAFRLEQVYTKEDILTLYFNTVPFGENIYGIESAALRFFNKEVNALNLQESAVLVGLLKANTYYNPRLHPDNAIRRRNVVLGQMKKYKYLTPIEVDSLKELPLALDYMNLASQGPANYFLIRAKKEAYTIINEIDRKTGKLWDLRKDGLIIKTTLDFQLQKYALEAFKEHLSSMQKKLRLQYKKTGEALLLKSLADIELQRLGLVSKADDVQRHEIFDWDSSYTANLSTRDSIIQSLTLLHAGLIAMDPNTGAIRAYVGGIDYNSQPYDQITAKRPSASTFKPILYTAAIEQGILPCTYLKNEFETLESHPDWQPQNYDKSEGGYYSLAGALIKSKNIPSINLYQQVGFNKLQELWSGMGFSKQLQNLPSNALGTMEASILELSLAYASIANGGFRLTPNTIISITTSDGEIIYENRTNSKTNRIISESSSQLMTAILEKVITEGTGRSMQSVYGVEIPLAGKTGTAQDYSDAWFASFNTNLVMVSRVGASTPSIHFNEGYNGSGSSLALPLVGLTLQHLQTNKETGTNLSTPFPTLSEKLEELLSCDDFKGIVDDEMDVIGDKPIKNTAKRRPASKTKPTKKEIRKKKRRIKKNKK